ncbi:MAG: GNAT family N-acetyltransferase [Erysipelothrix sp.]
MLRKMNLKNDNVFDIANLIYESDESLFGMLFGRKVNALTTLCQLIRNDTNSFSYKNIYVYEVESEMVGIILMYSVNALHTDSPKSYTQEMGFLQSLQFIGSAILMDPITNLKKLNGIYIQNVCIRKEYRGNNNGSVMMDLALEYLRAIGEEKVYLDASMEKPRVQSFYKKIGFKKIEALHVLFTSKGVYRMMYTL